MDYQNTLKYLYESAPMFQQIGGKAYKPGLETTHKLDEHFGHPHQQFKTIHIAGTNGKGSCSHTIAAVLQCAGYRVGLFTSPHLIDFRERIRINGEMILLVGHRICLVPADAQQSGGFRYDLTF